MYLQIEKHDENNTAMLDAAGESMTYGELRQFTELFSGIIKHRTLMAVLCRNTVGSVAGYYAAVNNRIVVLLLGADMDSELLDRLLSIYKPEYIWAPQDMAEMNMWKDIVLSQNAYKLLKSSCFRYNENMLFNELSLLLTTSGSTGSPKLVRHSYTNLAWSAQTVAGFFGLDSGERPMITLPMQYTYGLSVINSHLYSGAKLLLSSYGVMKSIFWKFIESEKATSFTGVPYTFELMKKLHFLDKKFPYLRTLSQGGGRMSSDLWSDYTKYAEENNIRFFFTYGQSEGTARMSFLPPELNRIKAGSIGRAVPGGKFELAEDNELCYEGPNVTLGYAETPRDLLKGDERGGYLKTGDIVEVDEDGCYFIIGRKARFLKIYGNRISLDECERIITESAGIPCACVGNDEKLIIYIEARDVDSSEIGDTQGENDSQRDRVKRCIMEKTGLIGTAVEVRLTEEIPRNPAGKIQYNKLV